jgi:hypothetical protein
LNFPPRGIFLIIFTAWIHTIRRKIRIIEGNAKLRHLKHLTVKSLCGWCLSV